MVLGNQLPDLLCDIALLPADQQAALRQAQDKLHALLAQIKATEGEMSEKSKRLQQLQAEITAAESHSAAAVATSQQTLQELRRQSAAAQAELSALSERVQPAEE
jgi:septal ring factor EnvC (AmiA/AmiB activator)